MSWNTEILHKNSTIKSQKYYIRIAKWPVLPTQSSFRCLMKHKYIIDRKSTQFPDDHIHIRGEFFEIQSTPLNWDTSVPGILSRLSGVPN